MARSRGVRVASLAASGVELLEPLRTHHLAKDIYRRGIPKSRQIFRAKSSGKTSL